VRCFVAIKMVTAHPFVILGSARQSLRFNDPLEGLTEIRSALLPIVIFDHNKEIQIKSPKAKMYKQQQNLGEIRPKFPVVLSLRSHKSSTWFSQKWDVTLYLTCLSGKLSRALLSRVFTGSQSNRHGAPTGSILLSMVKLSDYGPKSQAYKNIHHKPHC
jgi:hypothetical protein